MGPIHHSVGTAGRTRRVAARRSRQIRLVLAALGIGLLAALINAGPSAAASAGTSGVLYYTTFAPPQLKRVDYSLQQGVLRLTDRTTVTSLAGADGVVFDSAGHLLVGGADRGTIQQVDPETGAVTTVEAGGPAFLVTLDPSQARVWTAGLPGPLSHVALDPLHNGVQLPLSGDQTSVTGIAFDGTGRSYYTSSGPDGNGSFGRIDLATGRTTRLLADLPGAHGIVFDPYSHSLFFFGGQYVFQVNPAAPTTIVSSRSIPDVQLDSGTVDGQGHLFLASNFGQLLAIDYGATGHVGDATSSVAITELDANLDDVAPLSGLGSRPASSSSLAVGKVAAGTGAALPVAFGGFLLVRRIQRRGRPGLPAWDVRRQESR